jgi:hypothetical protein
LKSLGFTVNMTDTFLAPASKCEREARNSGKNLNRKVNETQGDQGPML